MNVKALPYEFLLSELLQSAVEVFDGSQKLRGLDRLNSFQPGFAG
jgi:hypothetical protein